MKLKTFKFSNFIQAPKTLSNRDITANRIKFIYATCAAYL